MGIFGTSSPFDQIVEKATDEKNTSEDWGVIMEICDQVGRTSSGPKDCLRSLVKRINNRIPHVALQALLVLDACVSNCGRVFHLEIASRDFVTEAKRIINGGAHIKVSEKFMGYLKKWSEGDFKTDSSLSLIPQLYNQLKSDGVNFSPDAPTSSSSSSASASAQEEEDIMKAIALSLKESETKTKTTSLYPSARAPSPVQNRHKELRKVRALYDFEAAEDNELTFKAGEIVSILDDSDQNWWKGVSFRGEGLFPANFVTADLSVEPEPEKKVQFKEEVEVRAIEPVMPETVEIDEGKIDECLNLIQNADPTGVSRPDTEEMLTLEEQCKVMGPLIDQELEQIDRKHNDLMSLNKEVMDALQMYNDLMKSGVSYPKQPGVPFNTGPSMPPPNLTSQMFNQFIPQGAAAAPGGPLPPSQVQMPPGSIPGAIGANQSPMSSQMMPPQMGQGQPQMTQSQPQLAHGQPSVGQGQPRMSQSQPQMGQPSGPASLPHNFSPTPTHPQQTQYSSLPPNMSGPAITTYSNPVTTMPPQQGIMAPGLNSYPGANMYTQPQQQPLL